MAQGDGAGLSRTCQAAETAYRLIMWPAIPRTAFLTASQRRVRYHVADDLVHSHVPALGKGEDVERFGGVRTDQVRSEDFVVASISDQLHEPDALGEPA